MLKCKASLFLVEKHTYTKKTIFSASYSYLAVKLFAQNCLDHLHFKAMPPIASLKNFVDGNTEFTTEI